MNLFKTETDSETEKKLMGTKEEKWRKDKQYIQHQQMHTTMHELNKKTYCIEHRELHSIYNGKEFEKTVCVCVLITLLYI